MIAGVVGGPGQTESGEDRVGRAVGLGDHDRVGANIAMDQALAVGAVQAGADIGDDVYRRGVVEPVGPGTQQLARRVAGQTGCRNPQPSVVISVSEHISQMGVTEADGDIESTSETTAKVGVGGQVGR